MEQLEPITNVADEVRKLKEEPGQDILVLAANARELLIPLDLIDEYQIMVFPVVSGAASECSMRGSGKPG